MSIIDQLIKDHLLRRAEAIDTACHTAMGHNCGVRVTDHEDGGYTVLVDPKVPPMTVHEHRK